MPVPCRRWWREALAGVLIGVSLLVMLFAGRRVLGQTAAVFGRLDWAWMPLALFAEASSMFAFARAQRRLLRAGGLDLHLRSMVAVTYAGNAISVSLPLAGAEAGAMFAFRQFRRRGASPAIASWALAISGLVSSAMFTLLVAGGAVASGKAEAALAGAGIALLTLGPVVVLLVAARNAHAHRLIRRCATPVISGLGRVGKRPDRPRGWGESLEAFLDSAASIVVRPLHYAEVFFCLLWNWMADCLCLAVAITATGAHVPWRGLFLAYGAAAAAAAVPLTPGGLGVVEVALSAALVAVGLHGSRALAAVLVYRLVSFWLVLAVGWTILAWLSRKRRQLPQQASAGTA